MTEKKTFAGARDHTEDAPHTRGRWACLATPPSTSRSPLTTSPPWIPSAGGLSRWKGATTAVAGNARVPSDLL